MTTNSAELKPLPCPFCGSSMDSFAGLTEDSFAESSYGKFMINCDCGVLGPEGKTMEEAIAAWNRRTAAQRRESRPRRVGDVMFGHTEEGTI